MKTSQTRPPGDDCWGLCPQTPGILEAWQDKRMRGRNKTAKGVVALGMRVILPPWPGYPCRVASPQSPSLFHQAATLYYRQPSASRAGTRQTRPPALPIATCRSANPRS
jgi:hypothetical protein